MPNNDGFTEVGGGDFWRSGDEPLQAGDSITGEYVNRQTNVGPNDSMVYVLRTADGDKSVWGSTVLDNRMVMVRLGDTVRITFMGLSENKGKFGKPFKLWKVEVKSGERKPQTEQDVEIEDLDSPGQNVDLNELPY